MAAKRSSSPPLIDICEDSNISDSTLLHGIPLGAIGKQQLTT